METRGEPNGGARRDHVLPRERGGRVREGGKLDPARRMERKAGDLKRVQEVAKKKKRIAHPAFAKGSEPVIPIL